jgi:hypothetical protein
MEGGGQVLGAQADTTPPPVSSPSGTGRGEGRVEAWSALAGPILPDGD